MNSPIRIERRQGMNDDEVKAMLARVDERTIHILAKLDRHIESHDRKGPRVAQWAGIVAAGIMGAGGLALKK